MFVIALYYDISNIVKVFTTVQWIENIFNFLIKFH